MSHFIVERIEADSDVAGTRVAQHLASLGELEGLTVRLLDKTSIHLQSEILSAAGLRDGPGIVFFDIVGASGTADELVSPYVLIDQWPLRVKPTAEAISRLVGRLLVGWAVREVATVFSEGYDTDYEVCEVPVETIATFLIEKFNDAGQVPSLTIVAKR